MEAVTSSIVRGKVSARASSSRTKDSSAFVTVGFAASSPFPLRTLPPRALPRGAAFFLVFRFWAPFVFLDNFHLRQTPLLVGALPNALPAPGLQHLGFVQPRYRQAFHRAGEVL